MEEAYALPPDTVPCCLSRAAMEEANALPPDTVPGC